MLSPPTQPGASPAREVPLPWSRRRCGRERPQPCGITTPVNPSLIPNVCASAAHPSPDNPRDAGSQVKHFINDAGGGVMTQSPHFPFPHCSEERLTVGRPTAQIQVSLGPGGARCAQVLCAIVHKLLKCRQRDHTTRQAGSGITWAQGFRCRQGSARGPALRGRSRCAGISRARAVDRA